MLNVVLQVQGTVKATATHYDVGGTIIPRTLVVAVTGDTVYYRAAVNLGSLAKVVEVKGQVCYVNTDGDKIVVFDQSALSLTASAGAAAAEGSDDEEFDDEEADEEEDEEEEADEEEDEEEDSDDEEFDDEDEEEEGDDEEDDDEEEDEEEEEEEEDDEEEEEEEEDEDDEFDFNDE